MNLKTIMRGAAITLSFVLFASIAWTAELAYRLQVDGLACPFCAYGIEKKLGAIKGVQRIEIDIATNTVTVTMAEGATLDEATAKKAVKEAGFSLRKLEPVQSLPQSTPGGPVK